MRDGTFREDLLFRLNVVNLKIPPLRERPADVIELAEYFVKKYAAANGVPERPLSAEARRTLPLNHWPGNVRELENTMHRAVLMASGDEIGPEAILTPDGLRLDQQRGAPARGACRFCRRAGRRAGWSAAPWPRSNAISSWRRSSIASATAPTPPMCSASRSARLRNKLNEYSADGVPVPPPGGGEPRVAA